MLSLKDAAAYDFQRTDYLFDTQQADPVDECDICHTEMFCGDPMYLWENKRICPDCLKKKFKDMSIDEKAELLGAEKVRAGE